MLEKKGHILKILKYRIIYLFSYSKIRVTAESESTVSMCRLKIYQLILVWVETELYLFENSIHMECK